MRPLTVCVAVLLIHAAAAAAEVLVLRDGQVVKTDGPYRVEGRRVIYTNLRHQLAAVRLSEVDLEASAAANRRLVELAVAEQIARQPGPTVVDASAAETARRQRTDKGALLLTRRGTIIALDELALGLGVPIDTANNLHREVLVRYLRQLAVFVDNYRGAAPERMVQLARNPVELQTLGQDVDRAMVAAEDPTLEALLGQLRKGVRDLELRVAVDPLGAVNQLAEHVRVQR